MLVDMTGSYLFFELANAFLALLDGALQFLALVFGLLQLAFQFGEASVLVCQLIHCIICQNITVSDLTV